jgi:hypothetical protein
MIEAEVVSIQWRLSVKTVTNLHALRNERIRLQILRESSLTMNCVASVRFDVLIAMNIATIFSTDMIQCSLMDK